MPARGSRRGSGPRRLISCTVVRHVEIEDLGYLGAALARNGIRFEYLDAESLPDPGVATGADGLIVLGGPMAAYQADRYPYLRGEIELIGAYLSEGAPVLGICLGAQLLAAAAGGRVYSGARGKEIGWAPVQLTEAGVDDPLWAGFPQSFTTFHWHGDTFELPDGAQLLARTDGYVQAFRLGATAYGVQFHPEAVPQQLESWTRAYRLELERERRAPEDVLDVPDSQAHRALAFQFGENTARWLRERIAHLEEPPEA